MALIHCPECDKEISDKVKDCPNCGYPLADEIKTEEVIQTKAEKKTLNKKAISITTVIILLSLIIGAITYITVFKPKNTYKEAVAMLENGKYDEAGALLDKISNYDNVSTVREQMKYESVVFKCITDLKKYLKNPDSLQIYEVEFFIGKDDGTNKKENSTEEKKPICIIHHGAQNGFGGNTTGYAVFSTKDYSYIGNCDTLDEDKISKNDASELLICKVINLYKKECTKVGSVDLSRIKTLLKNESYSTIKVIK